MFEELHDLYKNLKHLTDICECWIANEDSEAMLAFVKTIHEFISFFFDDYELHSEQHAVRKNAPINVNRQLLLRNMGLHFPVL